MVPRNYDPTKWLDNTNKNTKWQDSINLEILQLDEYDTFINHIIGKAAPQGYKSIKIHCMYDIKHDDRHKARCVIDGHLTDIPVNSVYSGVVSLRGLRIMLFLVELNKLDMWITDIGNSYLEAKTSKKVYIIAGPEFGEKQGATLVIHNELYDLRSSGQQWHTKLSDGLQYMGFSSYKVEPYIWMIKSVELWKYIAVDVDNIIFVLRDPAQFVKELEDTYKYKLKGTGSISFDLGYYFFRSENSTLCMDPRKCIER